MNLLAKSRLEATLDKIKFYQRDAERQSFLLMNMSSDNQRTIQAALEFLLNPVVTETMIEAFTQKYDQTNYKGSLTIEGLAWSFEDMIAARTAEDAE